MYFPWKDICIALSASDVQLCYCLKIVMYWMHEYGEAQSKGDLPSSPSFPFTIVSPSSIVIVANYLFLSIKHLPSKLLWKLPKFTTRCPFPICASYTQQQLQHSHPLSQFGIRRTWLGVVIIALIIWCRCLIFKCVGTTAAADRLGVYEGNTWVILSFLETQVGTFFEREPRMITCLLSTWMLSGSWHCRSQTASPFKKTRVYRQVVERWTC